MRPRPAATFQPKSKFGINAFRVALMVSAMAAGASLHLFLSGVQSPVGADAEPHHFVANLAPNVAQGAASAASAPPVPVLRGGDDRVLHPKAAAAKASPPPPPRGASPAAPAAVHAAAVHAAAASPSPAAPVADDGKPTPTASHTPHRSRSYKPPPSPMPSHEPIWEAWEAKHGKALTPSPDRVFKGPLGPDPALGPVLINAGPGIGKPCGTPSGCVFIAMTTCCTTWNRTSKLVHQLIQSDTPLHVAVFDDYSKDEGPEELAKLGVPVIQPNNTKREGLGLTKEMNRAWRYFYARDELDTMWVVNNDVEVASVGTFKRLNECLHEVRGPGVMGPMTNALGLGTGTHLSAYLSWQNAEHHRHRVMYGKWKEEVKIPVELRAALPESLQDYNNWLVEATAFMAGNQTARVKTLMGMVMGFKKDHPLHWPHENRFIHGSKNSDQEYYMFQTRNIPAYVCHSVFVYHDKTGSADPRIRAAMEHNAIQTNKKGQKPGVQS